MNRTRPSKARSTARPKHLPMRRCVVCRASRPQTDLLRLYRDEDGAWQFDLRRKAGGRGAWLCADKDSCHKAKALKRFFRADTERIATDLHTITSALNAHYELEAAHIKESKAKPALAKGG